MEKLATISDDGLYRYELLRRWEPAEEVAVFVMLNPSTADAHLDDPTIRRCMGFARSWGLGGILVVNLYAYRATKPADLWKAADPVGPMNDDYLRGHAEQSYIRDTPLIAAWGANAKPERIAQVWALPWMERLQVLDLTKGGQPRHPLYLPGDLTPRKWAA